MPPVAETSGSGGVDSVQSSLLSSAAMPLAADSFGCQKQSYTNVYRARGYAKSLPAQPQDHVLLYIFGFQNVIKHRGVLTCLW